MISPAVLAALSGLGLGLSLIVAIGAQNAFVLRQGLRGEYVLPVVAVCTLSDVVLIAAGVAGAGVALTGAPWAVTGVRLAGGVFLLGYGALAARRAWRPAGDAALQPAERPAGPSPSVGLATVLGTTLALTWLNPHVYLDTVVLLGSIAGSHGAQRWWFAVGAAVASTLWFGALGWGAALLRPLFARPRAWRVLDSLIAVVMAVLGVSMLVGA
ncbi:LysE/ArgO family amino acid transporter [Planosporangium sp. 12N6]|uniref:LysE/ArgO family amino acid transporter n=1 Tax=Planosporangium spinosum TaxID=3402278 RepID=UPI003CF533A5